MQIYIRFMDSKKQFQKEKVEINQLMLLVEYLNVYPRMSFSNVLYKNVLLF